MRLVMQRQQDISLFYGFLIIALCVLVALNIRMFVRPLIALIITSILFFYVDLDPHAPELVSKVHLSHVQTLTTIIGGLFLIHGFSSVPVTTAAINPHHAVKSEQPKQEKQQQQP